MFGIALIPLACYFLFLAALHIRRRPTLLTGRQDFMLLACGLFGLVTLGPGRLLIPISVLTYWHLLSWFFWAMFYFSAAYLATVVCRRHRLVIYHSPANQLIDKLVERTQQADPAARHVGNVLILPELGIQCTIEKGASARVTGQTVILRDTEVQRNPLRWELFRSGVAVLCHDLPVTVGRGAWFWGLLGGVCLAGVVASLIFQTPELIQTFDDYWLGASD